MIPQLINELFDAKEFPAARELAIAYLRNHKDENIMFLWQEFIMKKRIIVRHLNV